MTDDIDKTYETVQTHPLKNGMCPVCGLWMKGFVKCPWCNGERKVVKKQKRWIGGREI